MKKYFIISLFLGIFSSYAQQKVGIGIDEPTRTLDINGELRVQELKEYRREDKKTLGLRYLTADKEGNVEAYGNGLDYVGLGLKEGEKINTIGGLKAGGSAESFKTKKLTGMEVTATIPAEKRIVLVVSYSLPIGSSEKTQEKPKISRYFGVQLYRKDATTDEPIRYMTRKFTATNTIEAWDMVSITNQYVETFEPNPNERTVTFYLKGFVDNLGKETSKKIKFNMYATGGKENYNWGHAYMTYETLELKAKDKKQTKK